MIGNHHLTLNGTQVTGELLYALEQDPALQQLTIRGGPLTNPDLEPLGRLTRLKALCLADMRIDDEFFEHLRPLRNLEILHLASTNIRGDFSLLAGLPVRELNLEGCRYIGDAAAASIATAFPNLRHLEIHMTGLTDSGLNALSALPLETLWLGPRITDHGLNAVGRIATLRHLDLCAHMITDEGLPALSDLPNLEVLWLTRCTVTDLSIPVLAKLHSLKELNVSYTGISESGLAQLRAALPSTRFVDPD